MWRRIKAPLVLVLAAAAAVFMGCGDKKEDAGETSTSSPNTGDDAAGVDTVDQPPDSSCNSLFAAAIVSIQHEAMGTARDCDLALEMDVGATLCVAGETANDCRNRLYETPPPLDQLKPGCFEAGGDTTGCLRARYLPRCTDGTNDCETPDMVCLDGTRPMIRVEPAASSNRWIFYLGGEGGPCFGDTCWNMYWHGEGAAKKAMSSTHPTALTEASLMGKGIMSGNPGAPLSGFNRVQWNRCSDAISDGVETVGVYDLSSSRTEAEDPPATPGPSWGTVPVFHYGLKTWQGLFRSLVTDAGRDLDGDGTADLPSLADADVVLIAASSDASLWTVHGADRLRDVLIEVAGADVDVRILVDGYFDPMLDNEPRYAPDAPTNFSMLTTPYAPGDFCELPATDSDSLCSNFGYTESSYDSGDVTMRGTMDARSSRLDKSCEALHGDGAWQCYDRQHVLVHHVETPIMVVADQEDDTVAQGGVSYANDRHYAWPDDPNNYRTRVLDQARDLAAQWSTDAREDGPGTPGNLVLMLRKARRGDAEWVAANHTHFESDTKMQWPMTRCSAAMEEKASASIAEAILAWVSGSLPTPFIIEDGAAWDGASDFFISLDRCEAPE